MVVCTLVHSIRHNLQAKNARVAQEDPTVVAAANAMRHQFYSDLVKLSWKLLSTFEEREILTKGE